MKKAISFSFDEELIEWIDQTIKNTNFRNRSHFIEQVMIEYREKWNKRK